MIAKYIERDERESYYNKFKELMETFLNTYTHMNKALLAELSNQKKAGSDRAYYPTKNDKTMLVFAIDGVLYLPPFDFEFIKKNITKADPYIIENPLYEKENE